MDRRIALSRRDVLKLAIGVVALPVLSACTPSAPPAAPKTEAKPTEAPKPAAAKPTEVPKPAEAAKPAAAPAAAPAASKPAPAGAMTSAQRAIEEAKKFSGETLTLTWQSGLQAEDPLLFSGPKFEELTGVKIKVVEITGGEEFSKLMAEHLAGGGRSTAAT